MHEPAPADDRVEVGEGGHAPGGEDRHWRRRRVERAGHVAIGRERPRDELPEGQLVAVPVEVLPVAQELRVVHVGREEDDVADVLRVEEREQAEELALEAGLAADVREAVACGRLAGAHRERHVADDDLPRRTRPREPVLEPCELRRAEQRLRVRRGVAEVVPAPVGAAVEEEELDVPSPAKRAIHRAGAHRRVRKIRLPARVEDVRIAGALRVGRVDGPRAEVVQHLVVVPHRVDRRIAEERLEERVEPVVAPVGEVGGEQLRRPRPAHVEGDVRKLARDVRPAVGCEVRAGIVRVDHVSVGEEEVGAESEHRLEDRVPARVDRPAVPEAAEVAGEHEPGRAARRGRRSGPEAPRDRRRADCAAREEDLVVVPRPRLEAAHRDAPGVVGRTSDLELRQRPPADRDVHGGRRARPSPEDGAGLPDIAGGHAVRHRESGDPRRRRGGASHEETEPRDHRDAEPSAQSAAGQAVSTGTGARRVWSITSARIRSRSRLGRQPIAARMRSIDGLRWNMSSIPWP